MDTSREIISEVDVMRDLPITWPKPAVHHDILHHIHNLGAEIIFEDDHVIAFEVDDDEREKPNTGSEIRISIAPKKNIPSLLDIGVADAAISAHLLFAMQQVAFKRNLHLTGFEVRCNVLPPYQQRPHLMLHIRAGAGQPSVEHADPSQHVDEAAP